ncbi:unnamed protein product [Parascedosporium putredinis]|uniref:Uncharacterized protein n=1 Tax=Parascedosporium putredinis TaxID=1442378 RepID=A0A9P1H6W2_9PEZI|nr:unnamed protein product [Parascedosporium putredinis]CAI7998057.1 unnamed protein product [Parascedosporium putredinis]
MEEPFAECDLMSDNIFFWKADERGRNRKATTPHGTHQFCSEGVASLTTSAFCSLRLAYKLPQTTVNEQSRLLRRPTADRSRSRQGPRHHEFQGKGPALCNTAFRSGESRRETDSFSVMLKVLWVFEHPGYAIAHARLALNVSDSPFSTTPVKSP